MVPSVSISLGVLLHQLPLSFIFIFILASGFLSLSLHSHASRKRNLHILLPLRHLSNNINIIGYQIWSYALGSSIYDRRPTGYITSWMAQDTSILMCLKLNSSTCQHNKSLGSHLHHLLAKWLWASYWTILSFYSQELWKVWAVIY